MRLKEWALGSVFAASLALSACASAPTSTRTELRQIVSTTSFGMCVGYCSQRLEISEGEAVLVRQARDGRGGPQNLPDQRFAMPVTQAEWEDLARLAGEADISGLPDVIGCPDCADGGAESLTVSGAGGARTITFEYGADVAEAAPLLARVRRIRAQLAPVE